MLPKPANNLINRVYSDFESNGPLFNLNKEVDFLLFDDKVESTVGAGFSRDMSNFTQINIAAPNDVVLSDTSYNKEDILRVEYKRFFPVTGSKEDLGDSLDNFLSPTEDLVKNEKEEMQELVEKYISDISKGDFVIGREPKLFKDSWVFVPKIFVGGELIEFTLVTFVWSDGQSLIDLPYGVVYPFVLNQDHLQNYLDGSEDYHY